MNNVCPFSGLVLFLDQHKGPTNLQNNQLLRTILQTNSLSQGEERKDKVCPETIVNQNNRERNTFCLLGVLTIKLIFGDMCVETSQDPTAFIITVDLWSFMFQNNHYYLYMPLNYGAFYPVLSYLPSTGKSPGTDLSVVNVCENSKIHVDWHGGSDIPIPGYKDNMVCTLSDIGTGQIMSVGDVPEITAVDVSFDDLYEYDADGNLVPKDQTDFLKKLKDKQISKRIESEKDCYTIVLFKVNDMSPFSWEEAEQKCQEFGFHLINIFSIIDLQHLIEHILKFIYEVRIPMYTFYFGIHRQVSLFYLSLINFYYLIFGGISHNLG